jgi:uncharacterized protein YdbL (DUF1318 family)
MMKRLAWLIAPVLLLGAVPATSQPATLALAIQAGQVGERYDGYMDVVGTPSAEVRRQVAAVNIHRRNLYIELAERRNVTAQVVGVATACQLMRQLSPGEAYLLSDGVWRRWTPGQPAPVPQQCG